MRILGLDLGTRTLGLAISDATETIATFYGTLRFEEEQYDSLIEKMRPIIEKEKIGMFVLGLPKNMNNSMGESAIRTLNFKEQLEKNFQLHVEMQDERLSTVEATSYLISSDMSRKKRKTKVDGVAASIILQTYLDKKKGNEYGRKNDI
jgi:putative Holliday junction resolvase